MRLTTGFPSTRLLVIAGLACVLSPATPAVAQSPLAVPSPLERSAGEAGPTPASAPASAGQKYDGVVPNSTAKNPLPSAPDGGSYLVWTGFQMTATGSQVFLQTTRQVELDRGKWSKSAMTILLRGCRIHMANNRRKIDTRFFATPVSSVAAKQKGRDVEIRIALREPASADPRNQAGPDGTQFVVLDFPPGKAATEPSALQDLARGAEMQDGDRAFGGDAADSGSPKTRKAGKPGLKAAAQTSE